MTESISPIGYERPALPEEVVAQQAGSEQISEKNSAINRVVGPIPEKEKEGIKSGFAEKFEKQQVELSPEQLRKWRVEITPEQKRVIELIDILLNKTLREHGIPPIAITPKQVHILKDEFWSKNKTDNLLAAYSQWDQAIVMRETASLTEFSHNLVHEMLHFKSYNAVQITTKNELRPYRVGIAAYDRAATKKYLGWLNEAIVEDTAAMVTQTIVEKGVFKEDSIETKKAMETISNIPNKDQIYYAKIIRELPDGKIQYQALEFSYKNERDLYNRLLLKIASKKGGSIAEYKDLFAKCSFTGNLLPIARLIEGVYGKGSFRKIANTEMNYEQARKIIESVH